MSKDSNVRQSLIDAFNTDTGLLMGRVGTELCGVATIHYGEISLDPQLEVPDSRVKEGKRFPGRDFADKVHELQGAGTVTIDGGIADIRKKLAKIAKNEGKELTATEQQWLDEEVKKFQNNINSLLSDKTGEGIKKIVYERAAAQLMTSSVPFMNLRPEDKPKLLAQIPPINIPESIIKSTMQGPGVYGKIGAHPLSLQIQRRFAECFSDDPKTFLDKGYCILPEEGGAPNLKLDPKNIEKFSNLVNNDTQAFILVETAIKELERGNPPKRNSVEVDDERRKKITTALLPTLAELDPEYMQKERANIVADIANDLYKERSRGTKLFSWFKSYTIPQEHLSTITQTVQNKAREYERQNIAKSTPTTPKDVSKTALARLDIQVNKDSQTPLEAQLIQLVKSLDPKYMEQYGDKVATDLATALRNNKEFSRKLAKYNTFDIDVPQLKQVVKSITDKHARQNDVYVNTWISKSLDGVGLDAKNARILKLCHALNTDYHQAYRLAGLPTIKQLNEGKKPDLLELRKFNPAKFDEIVLEIQPQGHHRVTSAPSRAQTQPPSFSPISVPQSSPPDWAPPTPTTPSSAQSAGHRPPSLNLGPAAMNQSWQTVVTPTSAPGRMQGNFSTPPSPAHTPPPPPLLSTRSSTSTPTLSASAPPSPPTRPKTPPPLPPRSQSAQSTPTGSRTPPPPPFLSPSDKSKVAQIIKEQHIAETMHTENPPTRRPPSPTPKTNIQKLQEQLAAQQAGHTTGGSGRGGSGGH